MGTSLTPFKKLIKPDNNESVTVEQLNKNWDTIDASLINLLVQGIPDGKIPKIWAGKISTGTGAGGEVRTTSPATDANGVGGVWLGQQGIPTFEGVAWANISDAGNTGPFIAHIAVVEYSPTRIKYQGTRLSGGAYANGYGSIGLFVIIIGW